MLETLAKNQQINILILYGDYLSTSGYTIFNTFGKKEINEKIILDKRKVKEIIGNVTSISISARAYQNDFEIVERVLENYSYRKFYNLFRKRKSCCRT